MNRRVAVWLRVSTQEQRLDSQAHEIERYVTARGWNIVRRFEEQGISGAARDRKAVDQILSAARRREFDGLVVFRGDRAFRSAGKGILFIEELIAIGCAFVSIADGIDTSTPAGETFAKMVNVLAEWERRAIKDRIVAGIAAARARGQRFGRPRRQIDLARARTLRAQGMPLKAVARTLSVPPRTLRRALGGTGQKPVVKVSSETLELCGSGVKEERGAKPVVSAPGPGGER